MDQRIINLYDKFTHGGMSRREFLDRLTELAGTAAAAAALLPLLQNDYAQAAVVAENDARLVADRVAYDSPKGKINGYLVRPTAKGKRPAVIIIQENRGLNPHIEDVARRLAVEGYLAFAPDLLSVSGGTPPDEEKARELHGRTDPQDITTAAIAAMPFVLAHAESNGNVGVVGRSGTLGYEAADQMKALGIGISTSVGIGGDPINGSSHRDVLEIFEQDSETKVVLMIGEIGGQQEIEAGIFAREQMSKPLIAYIAGLTAPQGRRMGHAGAIISSAGESAAEKVAMLQELGVTICPTPSAMGETVAMVLARM